MSMLIFTDDLHLTSHFSSTGNQCFRCGGMQLAVTLPDLDPKPIDFEKKIMLPKKKEKKKQELVWILKLTTNTA